ncbi:MAG: SPFH domain-containing protein [Bacteroidia bacterium]|nr:SPFH domain-containing protein [Bacteroidia bacterium]
MIQEKFTKPASGFPMLVLVLLMLGTAITMLILSGSLDQGILVLPAMALLFMFIITIMGFLIVNPNESKVLVLFGKYVGTVKKEGFYWANPFYKKQKISLRARNFNGEKIKVNDHLGNPIEIAAVVVWKVEETSRAAFEVEDYQHFVVVQSEAALRSLAGKYSYDNFEDHDAEITLRSGGEHVNHELEEELRARLAIAGINIIEARISHLAYASEIAGAMLQRQQATAVVAARFKIVEGAVSMVEMALDELSKKEIVTLDDEKKAAMVSNLMVVLCGDKNATPVVNAGTLHQ